MKIKRFLGFVIVLFLAFILVACGDAGSKETDYNALLSSYLLDLDNTLTADFTLDSELKVGENKYDLTWTSSSSSVVIASTAVDGTYTVTVTRPEQQENVTLTVKLGEATKTFEFILKPYDVYDFTGAYVFAQDKQTVSSDFDLDTEFTKWGKTATIVWESLNTDYITISEDGKKAIVAGSSVEKVVTLKAKFTYGGETSAVKYTVTVFEEMDPMETIDYWYKNTGISQTLSGYIVSVATAYSASYGNVTFYMVDDSFKGGYYIFRGAVDAADVDKIVPGTHVIVSNTTNTSYYGLVETNAGGTVTFDDTPAIDIYTSVNNIDNLLTSNSPSTIYLTSSLCSISGWKVIEKPETMVRGSTKTVLKLERDGVTITVDASKYTEGYFSPWESDADPKFDALKNKIDSIQVGDYIDMTGILSYYYGYELHALSADLINVVSAPTADSLGKEVASYIAQVSLPEKASEAKSIDLVEGAGNVSVSWKLSKDSDVAKIEGNKLVITPGDKAAKVTIIGTFTNGSFSTSVYYSLTVGVVDNSVKTIEAAKALEKGTEVIVQGTVVATTLRGYVLYDGTAAVYVYAYGSSVEAEKNFVWEVGDTLKVTGKMDYYNVIELSPTQSEKADLETKSMGEAKAYAASDIDSYVAADGTYDQVYATFTGTLTINEKGYYNLVVEGTENQVSLVNLNDTWKAMLEDQKDKQVTVSGVAIGHSSNKYMNIMITSVDSQLSIKGAKAAPVGTEVYVEGQVVAVSSRGYILYDGVDAVYVYAHGSSEEIEKLFVYVEGDYIYVKGTTDFYNGNEIIPTETNTLEGHDKLYSPTPVVVDKDVLDAYVSSEATSFACELVKVTGTLEISEKGYYNVTIEGTENQVSLTYLTDDQKANYVAGAVEFYAFAYGHSSNKYMNVIPCTYNEPLPPYQEVYEEGALYVNPAFTAENCSWGGQALTFGTNGFATLEAAVAAVTADNTVIYLQSGEYNLGTDATITAPYIITFKGPNAGINGHADQRHDEAIIYMKNASTNYIASKGVTFDGVTLVGAGASESGILFQPADTTTFMTFENCIFYKANTIVKATASGATTTYTFANNYFYSVGQFAIWTVSGTSLTTIYTGNYFDFDTCGVLGSTDYNTAFFRIRCGNAYFYDNVFSGTFLGNPYAFEFKQASGSYEIMYNNFVNTTAPIYLSAEGTVTINNNFYSCADGTSEAAPTVTYTIADTLTSTITLDTVTYTTDEERAAAYALYLGTKEQKIN